MLIIDHTKYRRLAVESDTEYYSHNAHDDWVTKDYQTKIKTYANGVKEVSTFPVKAMQELSRARQRDGFTRPRSKSEFKDQTDKQQENNVSKATQHARQVVRERVNNIGATYLLTLTTRQNIQDIDHFYTLWQAFVRKCTAYYKSIGQPWHYVAVPEKQNRGAYHIHVAVVGRQPIIKFREFWLDILGYQDDGFGNHIKMGNVDIKAPRSSNKKVGRWDTTHLSNYLTKYISKEFEVVEKGRKRYYTSTKQPKTIVTRLWLAASTYGEALQETTELFIDNGLGWAQCWSNNSLLTAWFLLDG